MSKLKITRAEVELYEDNYKTGEGAYFNGYTYDLLEGLTFTDANGLMKAINEYTYGLFSYAPSDYIYIDGRIETCQLVTADEDEPSEEEREAWENGEIKLYTARLTVWLSVVPDDEGHELTEEEAEALGVEV